MSEYSVTLEDRPAPADVAALNTWIVDYNLAQVGDHWKGRLTILARDNDAQLAGGILGFADRGWLRVEILIVHERARQHGLGSRLLGAAEAEARRRGCHAAWLETFSFQALGFYEKHGYQVFGQLERYPAEHTRYFVRKPLE